MGMRTPFAIISGKGSIKEGTTHFWRQRLTALANIPLTLFLVWLITRLAGADRVEMIALLDNPIVAGLIILALVVIFWHMALGLQVVIEDYVHGEGMKIFLIIANNFFTFGIGTLSIVAVLMLSFGG